MDNMTKFTLIILASFIGLIITFFLIKKIFIKKIIPSIIGGVIVGLVVIFIKSYELFNFSEFLYILTSFLVIFSIFTLIFASNRTSLRFEILRIILMENGSKISEQSFFERYNNQILCQRRLDRLLASNLIIQSDGHYEVSSTPLLLVCYLFLLFRRIISVD